MLNRANERHILLIYLGHTRQTNQVGQEANNTDEDFPMFTENSREFVN